MRTNTISQTLGPGLPRDSESTASDWGQVVEEPSMVEIDVRLAKLNIDLVDDGALVCGGNGRRYEINFTSVVGYSIATICVRK